MHPHKPKILLLSGLEASLDLAASMYLLVDVWEQSYNRFFLFAKSPSRYGDFESPHLRHMMAEQAALDTIFYQEARVDPKKHLPRLYKFMDRSRRRAFAEQMDDAKRAAYEKMAAAFLLAAEQKHQKWNGTTWTRARHLLGMLCLEERRGVFATELLILMGEEEKLDAALARQAAAAAAAEQLPSTTQQPAAAPDSGCTSPAPPAPPAVRPKPADAVDRHLVARLHACHADGSLARELKLWGLSAAVITSELALLATVPQGDTMLDPVLGEERTPSLYNKFIPMLFVGFAHNLRLERYVSVLAQLEKAVP